MFLDAVAAHEAEALVEKTAGKIHSLDKVAAVKCDDTLIVLGDKMKHAGIDTYVSSFGVNADSLYLRGGSYYAYAKSYRLKDCTIISTKH